MRVVPDGLESGPGAFSQHPIIMSETCPPLPEDICIGDLDIVRKATPWLGKVTLRGADYFTDMNGLSTNRLDVWAEVEVDGYGHGIRITEPAPEVATSMNQIHMPGFGEMIEFGSARNFHDTRATLNRHARQISIASDGIGATGEKLTPANFRDHGVTEMGERRAHLLEVLVADEPTETTECSMGSVIMQHLLEFDRTHGHNLNLFPIHFDTAVVAPWKSALIMSVLFGPSMAVDVPRELVYMTIKHGPRHVLDMAPMVYERSGDGLALLRHMTSLLAGVPRKVTTRVAETYGGITVSGKQDPLKETGMWGSIKREIEGRGPGLHIATIPGRGHGIGADGRSGAVKVTNMSSKYGIQKLLQQKAA